MKNKNVIISMIILVSAVLVSSCSYNITRNNYAKDVSIQKAKQAQKNGNADCDVIIRRKLDVSKDDVKFLGKMKLREGGATLDCSEEDAINILKKEACFLGANLIIITHESRPNIWSTCYSCDASFYNSTLNSPINPVADSKKDEYYKKEDLDKRVKKDEDFNTTMIILAVVLGLVSGFLF